ncbi:hypothetical protein [Oceanicola sp. S124]|uniref:hypothetical protein n=1 Tax=Oceanicola sp. S124 TaxID=1042378 RepID=UPI00110F7219|nr:hypothetical protein [Oceanicola sp. S124]
MKTLKALGVATLIAASATSASFAADAAEQTPFVYGEAANAGSTEVRVNRGSDDAAKATPFVYEEAANAVTRADTSVLHSRFLANDDDAASQTPFVYAN